MSSDSNNRLPGRPRHYEVGYGKPPKQHRFKKGQSGNPSGRPKGTKSSKPTLPEERLKDIVLAEADRTIPVYEGGRIVTLTMAQAIHPQTSLRRRQRPISRSTALHRDAEYDREGEVRRVAQNRARRPGHRDSGGLQ